MTVEKDNCGHCKDCLHWSQETRKDAYPSVSAGLRPTLKWRHRVCLKVIDVSGYDRHVTEEMKIALPDNIAFLDVYEAYKNELMTGPEFGCIHFEPKT